MNFELPEPTATPEDRHRPGFGWAMFLVVIGTLIVLQLMPYLERGKSSSSQVGDLETSVRFALFQTEIQRRLGGKADDSLFNRELQKLERSRKNDPESAMLWVAVRDLLDRPVTKEDLAPLETSKSDEHRRIAEVFRSKTLTPDQKSALTRGLGNRFAHRLVELAALKRMGVQDARERVFGLREIVAPTVVGLLVLVAMVLGFVVLVIHRAGLMSGRSRPAGFPLRPMSPASADRYVGKAAFVLVLTMFGPALILANVKDHLGAPAATVLGGLFTLALMTGAMGMPIFGRKISLREIGWRTDRLGADALAGLAAMIANVPILAVSALVSFALFRFLPPAEHPITQDPSALAEPARFFATLFVASIVAPIVEETVFRGLVSPAMAQVFKPGWVGWLVSGLCFAAIHPTGIPAWLPLAMLGWVASYTNYQTGSLVSSVFMHAFHNMAVLCVTVALFA